MNPGDSQHRHCTGRKRRRIVKLVLKWDPGHLMRVCGATARPDTYSCVPEGAGRAQSDNVSRSCAIHSGCRSFSYLAWQGFGSRTTDRSKDRGPDRGPGPVRSSPRCSLDGPVHGPGQWGQTEDRFGLVRTMDRPYSKAYSLKGIHMLNMTERHTSETHLSNAPTSVPKCSLPDVRPQARASGAVQPE